MIIDIGQTTG